MSGRIPKTRAPRRLQEREVRLLLLRGGMLARTSGVWTAYRNHDIRRMRVGTVADALAEHLISGGAARAVEGPVPRLAAGLRLQA